MKQIPFFQKNVPEQARMQGSKRSLFVARPNPKGATQPKDSTHKLLRLAHPFAGFSLCSICQGAILVHLFDPQPAGSTRRHNAARLSNQRHRSSGTRQPCRRCGLDTSSEMRGPTRWPLTSLLFFFGGDLLEIAEIMVLEESLSNWFILQPFWLPFPWEVPSLMNLPMRRVARFATTP